MSTGRHVHNAAIDAHWIYGTHWVNLADMKKSGG